MSGKKGSVETLSDAFMILLTTAVGGKNGMLFVIHFKRWDNLEIKVFIHFFIHSCVFGCVYMGQPYFQVSFNESQVYLGQFTLKVKFLPGDCSPSCLRMRNVAYLKFWFLWAHSLCSNLLSHSPPKFVTLGYSFPLKGEIWAASLGCGLWPSEDGRPSLWCVGSSTVMRSEACSEKHALSREYSWKMVLTKPIWELLHTSISSWRTTMSKVKILLNFL